MKYKAPQWISPRLLVLLTLLSTALAVLAQTPVDADGKPLGPVYTDTETGDVLVSPDDAVIDDDLRVAAEDEAATLATPTLSGNELQALIGPVALYPDDLLAVVLPASTYPLQIVQAARYLEQRKSDASLQPDDAWDDSVVALLNYPEVLTMMSEDIDWTWRLGEAVVAQQGDVVAAVEAFRDRAYAAGNLKTDQRQTVSRNDDDIIEIAPVEDDVIYVPYYEPERVVVYQAEPVYHYYPRAYPVYYYPYPVGYSFYDDYFWGVTTAYRIGWTSNHLHVYHHSYRGHPYFGWNYYGNYWRSPSIQIFNTWYGGNRYASGYDPYRYGSYWRPRRNGGARPGVHPNRDRYYSGRRRSSSDDGYANRDRQRDTDRRDYRRDDRQYNAGERRRAGANSDTPRVARRNADNAGNAGPAPRLRDGANADARRNATPRLRDRNNANGQRDIAPRASGDTPRTTVRRNGNEQGTGIQFRDRSVDAAAARRGAGARNGTEATDRSSTRQRTTIASSAPTPARALRQDARDRAQPNVRERRATAPATAARRNPEPRPATTNSRVNPAPAPQATAAPVTRRASPQSPATTRQNVRRRVTEAPARVAPAARQDVRQSAAPQQTRQARQSSAPPQRQARPAAAPRASAAPQQRPAARNAAPQRRSADKSSTKSSRGGDRRRQRD